ncbi:signal peptidase I [Halomicrococcus gelatinilyticus]|uniref:signal peptidase I n=1 Tax=Halomicrococcus gelatinilyticus TaxID=1702103 RepID=UPI003898DDE7
MDESYVVLSGSMEPALSSGDVIYVNDVPAESINEGDVITFSEGGAGKTTTHRVVEKTTQGGQVAFITKGDNNENRDAETRQPDEIIGVVAFSVPLIGDLLQFAGARFGILAFIVVPSILYIALTAKDLWDEATPSQDDSTNR